MATTYHAGRRVQGTSTDAEVVYRGETPTTSGSDTIITFLQDGKFTPTSSFNVEYLVVGGGGGSTTGGGGAGGYLANGSANHGVTAQDYNITVGAGGTSTSLSVGNGKGGDSSFSSFTATGGGAGAGSDQNQTGVNGGSGGGGHSGWNPPATTGGAGNTPSTTPSQGNDGSGGAGSTWSYAYGGAGGGSASAGSGAQPRVGGSGTQNDITGTNTYYSAGGGGANYFSTGGAGGTGGGGNAGDAGSGVGQDGQTYGSGGGGTFVESGIASGKQGIVIIRFATSGSTYETSLGGRPTNVQAGSRWEETDTRKMYHYESGLKYEDNFSSNGDWVFTTSNASITGGVLQCTQYRSANDSATVSVGTSIGTKFLQQFEYEVDSYPSSNGSNAWYGLWSLPNTTGANTGGQDFVVLLNNDGVNHKISVGQNTSAYGGTGSTGSTWIVLTVGTKYYIELIGNGDDTYTLNIRTVSHTGSHVTNSPQTVTKTGLSNLQYFGFKNTTGGGNGGTVTKTDDLKIYKGITTAGNVWSEEGT